MILTNTTATDRLRQSSLKPIIVNVSVMQYNMDVYILIIMLSQWP